MSTLVVFAAVAALSTTDPRTADLNAAPPSLRFETDSTTQLSVGFGMTTNTFKAGDPIIVYLALRNATGRTVSAFHLPGELSLVKVGESDDQAKFGFTMGQESRPPSITSEFGELAPGATYNSVFVLSDRGQMPEPGTYRVRVKVMILRGLLDHRPIGIVSPPAIVFTVVP